MVVDTSALVAILKVGGDAATLLETQIVVVSHLCDCFSYGLAKALDAPLLFKGDDFRFSDVEPA